MSTELRKRLLSSRSYSPKWKGPVEGYVVNFLKKNYWRVENYMCCEDCMQEAQVTFCRVKNKYGNLDTPQHFMALFKTAWTNDFNDLSILASKYANEVSMEDYPFSQHSNVDLKNDGELSIMVEEAPSDIKLVLSLFLNTPVELLETIASLWKSRGKYNEFGDAHLCELLGFPEKTKIVEKINEYFMSNRV